MKKFGSLLLALILMLMVAIPALADTVVDQGKDFAGKITVNGIGIYTEVAGKNQGAPTLVFEHGYGDDHTSFATVQAALSQVTRTVSYDRPGQGQSDMITSPQTPTQRAEQLHQLLTQVGVEKPFVFVAHSVGGMYARIYADMYPGEVKGIVFIDSADKYQYDPLLAGFSDADKQEIINEEFYLPNTEGNFQSYLDTSAADAKAQSDDVLRNIPITVLSATTHGSFGPDSSLGQAWAVLQNQIAALSNKSTHITVDSGHYIHQEHPDIVTSETEKLLALVGPNNNTVTGSTYGN